ncbi:hypothetical protein HDV00_000153 [Rhizophlyctis rosea]|nr:hypothetical protein HDV00_000153 [Rhizophlyctis rosea]
MSAGESGGRKRKWDVGGEKSSLEPESQRVKTAAPFEAVRSPTAPNGTSSPTESAKNPLDRAAEAAARINSSLFNKAALGGVGSAVLVKGAGSVEYVKDIEINDLKNRYMLTKGATQSKIKQDTGADVTTRGKYYPDKKMATERDPPLYLHVSGMTQEILDKAVAEIERLIEQAQMPAAEPERRGSGPGGPPRQYISAKVDVGIDDRTFNVRAKIVGPGGQYVKHIQQETATKVQLKGRGSGFIEIQTGEESPDPLHIHVTGTTQDNVDRAVGLCEDLVKTVKQEYERSRQRPFANRPPPPRPYQGYGGGYAPNQGYGYQAPPPPPPGAESSAPPPPPPGAPYGQSWAPSPTTPDSASSAYAYPQQYDQQQYDDYTAQYYQQYYQQYGYGAYPAATTAGTEQNAATATPPGIADGASAPEESYNAVPPPAGL